MKYIQELQHNGLRWVNVGRQTEKELREVGRQFGLLQADINEALPPFQRPKIVQRPDYYFIVLHFPVFDRETKRLGFTEVDFFLNPNYLITVHDSTLPPIDDFFNLCKKDTDRRQTYFDGSALPVMLELLERLQEAIFPSLLHINTDINEVDRQLFSPSSNDAIAEEILRLKTNIVTFRRTMQGHRTVLDRLVMYGGKDLRLVSHQSYLNSLRQGNAEIWHMLESQQESINALHQTYESILTMRTNQVMKTLTVISVITFPLTLLATLFAIRAPGTPFVDHPWGFVILMAATIIGAAAMLVAFKKKGWL